MIRGSQLANERALLWLCPCLSRQLDCDWSESLLDLSPLSHFYTDWYATRCVVCVYCVSLELVVARAVAEPSLVRLRARTASDELCRCQGGSISGLLTASSMSVGEWKLFMKYLPQLAGCWQLGVVGIS